MAQLLYVDQQQFSVIVSFFKGLLTEKEKSLGAVVSACLLFIYWVCVSF